MSYESSLNEAHQLPGFKPLPENEQKEEMAKLNTGHTYKKVGIQEIQHGKLWSVHQGIIALAKSLLIALPVPISSSLVENAKHSWDKALTGKELKSVYVKNDSKVPDSTGPDGPPSEKTVKFGEEASVRTTNKTHSSALKLVSESSSSIKTESSPNSIEAEVEKKEEELFSKISDEQIERYKNTFSNAEPAFKLGFLNKMNELIPYLTRSYDRPQDKPRSFSEPPPRTEIKQTEAGKEETNINKANIDTLNTSEIDKENKVKALEKELFSKTSDLQQKRYKETFSEVDTDYKLRLLNKMDYLISLLTRSYDR
jgi:hypothetical protein